MGKLFNKIETIYQFKNDEKIFGAYIAEQIGNFKKPALLVVNGPSIGMVTHLWGAGADKCILIVTDEVKSELMDYIMVKGL